MHVKKCDINKDRSEKKTQLGNKDKINYSKLNIIVLMQPQTQTHTQTHTLTWFHAATFLCPALFLCSALKTTKMASLNQRGH